VAPGLPPPPENPENYLRLVANPFLAFFGFILWLVALVWVVNLKIERELIGPMLPIIAIVFLAALWKVWALLQYHCLDCGHTGYMKYWREHLCAASAHRRDSGRRRRFRGPSLVVQMVLWLWGILLIGIVATSQGWLSIHQ
jgi:hypothetical protein